MIKFISYSLLCVMIISNLSCLKKIALLIVLVLFTSSIKLFSQERFTSRYFENICVEKNITYCIADSWDLVGTGTYNPKDIKLDIYYPIESSWEKRPMVMCLFGGAFLAGNKDRPDIVAWCDSLAHYGYVAVAINYRLGFNPVAGSGSIGPATGMKRAAYRAIQDCRSAIHFVKEKSEEYRIDTSQIFLLGNSAGAITAINMVFLAESERLSETYNVGVGPNNADLGSLDCNSLFPNRTSNVAGVVGLWGATMDLSWFDNGEQVPMLFIHGSADEIVPYNQGYAFNYGSNTNINVYLYGSEPIYQIFEQNNWTANLHIYDNQPHAFYSCGEFNMTNLERENFPCQYWDTVFNEVINWLCVYNNNCSDSDVASNSISQKFKIYPNPAKDILSLMINDRLYNNTKFIIYNAQGKIVYQTNIASRMINIDIRELPKGIYFSEVLDEKGRYVSKLLIE